jgi:antirestriction protein ArdC
MTPADAKERAAQALRELGADLAAGKSDRLTAYLETMRRFRRYSWRNCMMIAIQCPEATHVAGFRTWLQLGRHVRKGEHGILILAPMSCRVKGESQGEPGDTDAGEPERVTFFRGVYVFDESQTEGEPLPQIAKPKGEPGELLERLKTWTMAQGIEIVYQHVRGALGTSGGGQITIEPGLAPAYEFDVLAHELGHELLHPIERRREMTKELKETEAQAVAAAVCAAAGVQCGANSADYIHMAGDPKALSDSLSAIYQAATRIIDGLTGEPADMEVAA